VRSLSIPVAIVVGLSLAGAFVAVGVYLALRPRGEPGAMASAPAASTSITNAATGAQGATVAVADIPTEAMAQAEATRGLDEQHAHLVDLCWAPSFAKKPTPATTTIVFTMTFGPDGRLMSRAPHEDLATARPDVTACVQRELVARPISPRGAKTHVEYTLTLP
jgi:hypothetical protein